MNIYTYIREEIIARLRMRLFGNRYLVASPYWEVIKNMPEPYRTQLLYGDFKNKGKQNDTINI